MKLKYKKLGGIVLAIATSISMSISQRSANNSSPRKYVLVGSTVLFIGTWLVIHLMGQYSAPIINLALEFIYGLGSYLL